MTTNPTNDTALLRRVFDDERSAWVEFFERFQHLIFHRIIDVASRQGVHLQPDDLADAYSEVCMNLIRNDCRKLRAYKSDRGCSLSSWIGIITTSTTLDYLRAERRRRYFVAPTETLESMMEPVEGPDAAMLEKQRLRWLSRSVAKLSKRDRQFAELYFEKHMAPKDIATQMGISVATVYSKKAKLETRLMQMAARAA